MATDSTGDIEARINSENATKSKVDEAAPVTPGEEAVPELIGLTPEEVEKQKAEWSQELARVEDEIATLRLVLASKVRVSSELKRKLGISVWKEFADDMNQGIKNVKESQVYHNVENCVGQITKVVTDAPVFQKTESVIKTTAEKTSSLFGGLTSKLGQMRNSDSFRSFEEKMGSAYENVKGKVSRSNSEQNFDECMSEGRDRRKSQPVATSPTIPENVPLQ
ncbi:tumor protein D54 isoform X3 [Arctopsyche grandis]|uniref:tumor protein D54 isoform X3 n=1 Tax=Arctopsyche grandis TaxID=121162 RepID=UPI00406D8652